MKLDFQTITEKLPDGKNSSAWLKKQQDVADMTARYGNAEKFLNTFKPDMQVMAARYTERAYFGTAPMLETVCLGYGELVVMVFICALLEDINLFVGVKEKMPGQPPARVVASGVGGISLFESDGIAVVFPSAEMRTLRPFLRDGGCVDCHQCADAVYGRTPDGDKPL